MLLTFCSRSFTQISASHKNAFDLPADPALTPSSSFIAVACRT